LNSPDLSTQRTNPSTRESSPFWALALLALWSGIIVGLIEGIGFLVFQRINWARWGPMVHVSLPIIWISPIVDVSFFLLLSIVVWLLSRASERIPGERAAIFLFSFLAVYDWLTLTARLYHFACVLLALGAAVASTRWLSARQESAIRHCRKTFPAVLGLFAVAFIGIEGSQWWSERSATAALPNAEPGAPNVLVIVIDTLRTDHVSAYGYSRLTTPNIDRLASQGVLFENAISPSSWSLPSHVSLVTGRYLHDHKVGNVQPEPWLGWGKSGLGGFPTIGEALEKKGYRTGAFSANRTYFSHNLGFGRGFMHFEDYFNSPADAFVRTLYGREFSRLYLNRSQKSKITRALIWLGLDSLLDKDSEGSALYGGSQAIRKRGAEVNAELLRWIDRDKHGHPFFAFINYFDVHFPYGTPRGYPSPGWSQNNAIDRYDAGTKYVDDCIGHLLSELKRRGKDRSTLVVITSDHGESLGQHGLRYHGAALYWEQIHVPLVIWFPGHVPGGVRITQPVTNSAIATTIMTRLGGTNPFPGSPLISPNASTPNNNDWADPIAEEDRNPYLSKDDRPLDPSTPTVLTGWMDCLVSSHWHFIRHEKAGAQLYDWVNDPGELHNLINTPEGKAEGQKLELELKSDKLP
jgi:arylsulfatase A-like enzyme